MKEIIPILLFEAAKEIAQRPLVALRLLFLPLFLTLAAELFYTHRLISFELHEDPAGLVIATVINFICVGLIAVGWHRHILLGAPVPAIPSYSMGLYWNYFKHWLILGFVIGFAMLLVRAIFAVVVSLFLDMDTLTSMLFDTVAPGLLAILSVVVVFCWALFRFGIVLPHVALGHDDMGFGRAWDLTRPQAGAIFWTAVAAAAVQIALYPLVFWMSDTMISPETGVIPASGEYAIAVFTGVIYTLFTLFGAAILTVIYGRIPQEALDAPTPQP